MTDTAVSDLSLCASLTALVELIALGMVAKHVSLHIVMHVMLTALLHCRLPPAAVTAGHTALCQSEEA